MSVYRHRSGAAVEVITGDAWETPADALVFGRTHDLSREIETRSGKPFRRLGGNEAPPSVRGVLSDRLPWRRVVSLSARVRTDNSNGSRARNLALTIAGALLYLDSQFGRPRRIVILPVSHRHPEVVAAATVAALWSFMQQREAAHASGSGTPWTFILADRRDSSPYEPLLRNHNGCLGDILKRGDFLDDWTRHDLFSSREQWGSSGEQPGSSRDDLLAAAMVAQSLRHS